MSASAAVKSIKPAPSAPPVHVNHQADFSQYERMRLSLAARIAGGICANPEIYAGQGWEGEAARAAMRVADRLLSIHYTGAC